MEIINVREHTSIVNQYLAEIRDVEVQKDQMRFRKNIERIGEGFAFEISKRLNYEAKDVTTPLGTAHCDVLSDQIVIGSIMRAALPMHQGMLNVFDKAQNAFIGAFRKSETADEITIKVEYATMPVIEGKTLILVDPMLATGSSLVLAYKRIIQAGKPAKTHIVSAISSKEGVEYVQKELAGENITLWVGDIDPKLNENYYIVPGLGDAGDLSFGIKL